MNQRQMQIMVGVVVFATFLIGGILMMVNSPIPSSLNPFGRGTYSIAIKVPQALGVGPDTPVRKNGILIGRVDSVEDADDGVIIHANIDEERTLTTANVPHVSTSVMDDATIDFTTDSSVEDRQTVVDGQVISGKVDPSPFAALSELGKISGSLDDTVKSLGDAGNAVTDLANKLQEVIGDAEERAPGEPSRVSRLMDTTERAMGKFERAMTLFSQILGDRPENGQQPANGPPAANGMRPVNGLQPAFAQLPAEEFQIESAQQLVDGEEMRERLRQGLNELPDAIHEAHLMFQSANRNLQHLEGLTQPLGERGQEIAESIIKAVEGVDRLVEEFTILVGALNDRQGTLGQLIHNPQLYQNLNNLTLNANQLIVLAYRIAERLRPVIEDARVFMDKIAREPGRVISGAVHPSQIK